MDVVDIMCSYWEFDVIEVGKDIVVVDLLFGKIGLVVCYDLCFSGLFIVM